MLVVSLFVCIQKGVERFQTRKKLASITIQQMSDIGMTKELKDAELAQATLIGFIRDVLFFIKNKGRME
ncbi:hypothetical protein EBI01_02775 [Marinomonas rhizomae]|uniref:Uncharacterized protein n=1 Tax=Marinomonas rhizomae TaxID=491948 RepID=A0A366JH02_9GAMM|nr:hypothetical protein [Marinomonas rhizomae]RBP85595.1 hypothetical protein DFP80_10190 [Marinomonas rhizomae]RNF75775.1 hypothetical protein EBI01_02775 [Marinomonas rhizomae]